MMENRNETKTNEQMTEKHAEQGKSQSETEDRYNTHDIKMAKGAEQEEVGREKKINKNYTHTLICVYAVGVSV